MEDVIFAGSAKRPALSRAEVSLTIDNSGGLLPIEFSEVTITRTLFRSGDSEYAINGVPCRLLDIQELLSDSGVGRQQHVIVSQGQLAQILDSRPEDRRLVIEEAAGVLKHRRRREKAQRRLEATEGNLLRLQDLLREVRRQLRPLERQADAARRHGSLVEELQGIRLFLAGREIGTLQGRLDAVARTKVERDGADGGLRAALARLDADVSVAEAAVNAQRGDDLGDSLLRYEGLRERARGLAAVLAERRRSVEREVAAAVDEDVIASLEADANRLASQLQEVEADAAAVLPQADQLAAAEAALAAERAAFAAEWGDGAAPPVTSEAAEVRGELSALRSTAARGRSEVERVESRLAALAERAERLAAEIEERRAEVVDADAAEQPLADELEAAESVLEAAEEDARTWTARAEALSLALDQVRARAGAERLAEVPGVVGTLLEVVEVDDGWEDAFEAALGEAVTAVVVDGVDVARRALSALRAGDASGAVLALDAVGSPASLALDAAAVGGEPVRSHVRSRLPSVDRLLDTLLGHAVCVDGGWEQALDVALQHPGVIAVTRDGDRFADTGWRAGAGGTRATGAALEEARERAAAAVPALEAARSRHVELAHRLDDN